MNTCLLQVDPLARLSGKVEALAYRLFDLRQHGKTSLETSLLERILDNLGNLFITKKFKVTTLYTSATDHATVWTIAVRREEEVGTQDGMMASQRIDLTSLKSLANRTSRHELVRNFLFKNFISDPMAYKHFEYFLTKGRNRDHHNCLHLYDEVERYKKLMFESVKVAEHIYQVYINPHSNKAVKLTSAMCEKLTKNILQSPPHIEVFDDLMNPVSKRLREEAFKQFTEDQVALERLKTAKEIMNHRSIMFEKDYPNNKVWSSDEIAYVTHRTQQELMPEKKKKKVVEIKNVEREKPALSSVPEVAEVSGSINVMTPRSSITTSFIAEDDKMSSFITEDDKRDEKEYLSELLHLLKPVEESEEESEEDNDETEVRTRSATVPLPPSRLARHTLHFVKMGDRCKDTKKDYNRIERVSLMADRVISDRRKLNDHVSSGGFYNLDESLSEIDRECVWGLRFTADGGAENAWGAPDAEVI